MLVIPSVLDKSGCDNLIRHWEQAEKIDGSVSSYEQGQLVNDLSMKRRNDDPHPR